MISDTSNIEISPLCLKDFLVAKGWEFNPELIEEGIYVLSHQAFARRQLVFPVDDSFDDFQNSALRALEKVSKLENRNLHDVLADFSEMSDDTLAFRVVDRDRNKDYIPLSYAFNAINGAKRLLQAAACSVVKPQVHHPRMNRAEALKLIEKSRFRHTESGSFVLKVSTPIQDSQLNIFGDSFVRDSMTVINKGALQLVRALQQGTDEEFVTKLREEEKPLVSSNLCEAITRFGDDNSNRDLYLNFKWAAIKVPSDELKQSIKIQYDFYPRINQIWMELKRQVQEDEDDVFIGTVRELAGEIIDNPDNSTEGDSRREGYVILDLYDKDEEISIKARAYLQAEWHNSAITAYKKGSYVKIKGKLLAGNQPRSLTGINSFSIIKD